MSHLTVDGPRLLVGGQVLLKLYAQHLVLLTQLGEEILQLDDLRPQFLLRHQFFTLQQSSPDRLFMYYVSYNFSDLMNDDKTAFLLIAVVTFLFKCYSHLYWEC